MRKIPRIAYKNDNLFLYNVFSIFIILVFST